MPGASLHILGEDCPLGTDETEGVSDIWGRLLTRVELGVRDIFHWEADMKDLTVIVDVSVVTVFPALATELVHNLRLLPDGGVVGDQTVF